MSIYVVVDIGAEGIEDVLSASTDRDTAIRFAQGSEGDFYGEVWELEDGEPNETPKCILRIDA